MGLMAAENPGSGMHFACIQIIQQGVAMQLSLEAPLLALETGQVLSLDDAAGTRILTRSGVVWVTCEGSAADTILGPGEAHRIGRGGRTVVQALEPAWVALQ
jgi:hypothetical protein